MTTKDFENFKEALNLSVTLDTVMRSITEKLKLISKLAQDNPDIVRSVIIILRSTDASLDNFIHEKLCINESEN